MQAFSNLFTAKSGLPYEAIGYYVLAVLAVFSVLFIIYLIAKRILVKLASRPGNELFQRLIGNLRVPVLLLLGVLALWLPLSFTSVPEVVSHVAGKILSILFISVVALMAIRVVHLIKYLVLKRYDIDQKDNLRARKIYTQFRILERVMIFIIILVGISLALMTFSEIRKIGVSIIASAGVTGIIVGLAAQKIIGGVLAGIQIAITQPITIDDVVVVENEWGRIEEIHLTYVVVKIWDERRLVLPTTYFIEKPFQNWTKSSSEILGTVFIYTDYKVPIDYLRKELTRLLEGSKLWDRKVNVLQVTNATEKTVEVRALMSAVDSGTAWDLRVYVREHLIKFLQENYPESLPRSRVVIEEMGKK